MWNFQDAVEIRMRPFISAFSIYMTVTIKATIQVGLLPFKKIVLICFNEVPLKMIKNAFYFMLKTLSLSIIFSCKSWLFGYVEKRLDKKAH